MNAPAHAPDMLGVWRACARAWGGGAGGRVSQRLSYTEWLDLTEKFASTGQEEITS